VFPGNAFADEVGPALYVLRPAEAPAVIVVGSTTVWIVLVGAGSIWRMVHEEACPGTTVHDELYSVPWLVNSPEGQMMEITGIRVVKAGLLTVSDVSDEWWVIEVEMGSA
jgi:hypothetical protein